MYYTTVTTTQHTYICEYVSNEHEWKNKLIYIDPLAYTTILQHKILTY